MLAIFALGLSICLVQANGDSNNTGSCTFTTTCPITPPSQDKVCNALATKLQQLDAKINAKLDRLIARVNITDFYSPSPLLHSCEEIKTNWPDSPSDYYIIADTNGHPRHVYCHMESLCNYGGGWMRVAYLNMSDPTEECPPGFRLYNQNGIRACGRSVTSERGYCQSVMFPSYSISYSQVCGRITGYQWATIDAINYYRPQYMKNINAAYVDGVSLTYGNPRNHIWTFMASLQKNFFASHGQDECPCAPNSPVTSPSFVGNDYFCESGCSSKFQFNVLYTEPLWDGKNCGLIEKECCTRAPWFCKNLTSPTTDSIELRICADENTTDEDAPVGHYELYVK